MRELQLPGITRTGMEPWVLFGEAMALSAHAHYAAGADVAHGRALFRAAAQRALRVLDPGNPHLDYPASGLVLFALGAWGLLRRATPADDALRLLALADRFAYNRMIPTMAWERIAPARRGSARLAGSPAAQAEYGDRRAAGPAAAGATGGRAARRLKRRGSAARGAACSCAPTAARRSRSPTRPASSVQPTWLLIDAVVGQVARGGHQVRDRVDLHERRQPARQRA